MRRSILANNLEARAKKIREWWVGINSQSPAINCQSKALDAEVVSVPISAQSLSDRDNRDSELEVVGVDETLAEIEDMGLRYG